MKTLLTIFAAVTLSACISDNSQCYYEDVQYPDADMSTATPAYHVNVHGDKADQ